MMFAKETYVHENDKNYAVILSYLLDAFIGKKKYAHVHITVNFVLGFNVSTRQPLWVILCRLTEKGRRETAEIVQ